jgi:hypothetical protein
MIIYWAKTNNIKKNKEALLDASEKTGLELNAGKNAGIHS